MKKLVAVLAVLALLAGGWLWGSPYLTLRQMKAAADARDLTTLSAHIDYPALRNSVKQELRGRMDDDRSSLLGRLVAGGIAERIVDVAVTPQAMPVVFAAAPAAAGKSRIGLRAEDMAYVRDGWDSFRLERRDGERGALLFRLRGVSWQLTGVEVPRDAFR